MVVLVAIVGYVGYVGDFLLVDLATVTAPY